MKLKTKNIIKYLLITVFLSACISLTGYFVASLISKEFSTGIKSVMFIEGIITLIIGLMSMMEGNPSGINITDSGRHGSEYLSYMNLEVTRMERNLTNYFKNFMNHSIVEIASSSLTIVLGGVFILLYSFI